MLKKAHISRIKAGGDDWYIARLAKFTSSEIHYLAKLKGIGDGGKSYIRRKVGEEITGKPAREEIDTAAIRHGLMYEEAALRKFGIAQGLEFLVVQQLICDPDTRFGSTPDGLIVLRVSPDGLEYEVEPVEVKCPPTYDNYIALFECETARDLKETKPEYYWQVLDQMDNCGARRAHFVIYHPEFKAGNHKTLVLDRREPEITDKGKVFLVNDDIKMLHRRKDEAVEEFERIRAKLMRVAPL